MGGLTYLEGSHRIGREDGGRVRKANAGLSPEERISAFNRNMTEGGWVSKDLPDMAERFDTRWLIADYEAGDVVLHSPFMIHASTTNQVQRGASGSRPTSATRMSTTRSTPAGATTGASTTCFRKFRAVAAGALLPAMRFRAKLSER